MRRRRRARQGRGRSGVPGARAPRSKRCRSIYAIETPEDPRAARGKPAEAHAARRMRPRARLSTGVVLLRRRRWPAGARLPRRSCVGRGALSRPWPGASGFSAAERSPRCSSSIWPARPDHARRGHDDERAGSRHGHRPPDRGRPARWRAGPPHLSAGGRARCSRSTFPSRWPSSTRSSSNAGPQRFVVPVSVVEEIVEIDPASHRAGRRATLEPRGAARRRPPRSARRPAHVEALSLYEPRRSPARRSLLRRRVRRGLEPRLEALVVRRARADSRASWSTGSSVNKRPVRSTGWSIPSCASRGSPGRPSSVTATPPSSSTSGR